MATLIVRVPPELQAEIAAEAKRRGLSKSDVVRERLIAGRPAASGTEDIADLIGALAGAPADMSSRVKHRLRASGYGRDRRR